jgi:hypothetical protein
MFSFNGAALKKLSKELGKLPKLIEQAEAMTLNNMAFKFKEEAANAIIGEFTSRRPDFVKRQFRVTKATAANLQAIAGSVGVAGSESFTGFVEMLPGESDDRERVPTMAARYGNPLNMIPKNMRMNPGQNFPEITDADDIPPMLAMIYRAQGEQGGVIIRGGQGWTPGLYKFGKPKGTGRSAKERMPVKLVQSFEKPKQPRKFDWIAAALSKITDAFVSDAHNKNLDYLAKKQLKKVFK